MSKWQKDYRTDSWYLEIGGVDSKTLWVTPLDMIENERECLQWMRVMETLSEEEILKKLDDLTIIRGFIEEKPNDL